MTENTLERLGWIAVIFLAVLTTGFAIHRFGVVGSGTKHSDVFDVRYDRNPGLSYLHLLPGVIFMVLGPLQFSRRIRAKRLNFHRWSGRIFLIFSLGAAISGMVLAMRLPAFGGLNTAVATYFFGPIFIFSMLKAYYHIRRKEILLHREWMIRGFAIGLGVSTIRVVVGLFQVLAHFHIEEIFGISFWLGFGINMIAAEIWINHTRARTHAVS